MSEAPPSGPAVLAALQALCHDPSPAAKAQANDALQRFQRTQEAWSTANELLLAQELPLESRLFAAQTFRAKVTFDLESLAVADRVALRDRLLHALAMYARGPRVVQTQLCLALAALALQLSEEQWGRVVPGMIEQFGGSPETVGVLLEFLTVLPEEVATNARIPVDNATYHERVPLLLTAHAGTVLEVLAMYMHAQGVTGAIQATVFACLRSWLKAGEIAAAQLAETPLLDDTFSALASDELFDVVVDVACDVINETQELDENQRVIAALLPRIDALRPALAGAGEDEDKVRGLCRIFVQAGETYHTLVLPHRASMQPIAQAILECASYHDLDIVQITFRFWYLLSTHVHKAAAAGDEAAAPFQAMYAQLFAVVIRHLRFPDDDAELTGQERDDFRAFRHYMGDTLKDCCYVLGPETCLARSLQLIEAALSTDARWQDLEAPLFSMRSMGGQVDLRDEQVVPRILDLVPRLPPHPRLRYAGLLVLSRYTEWVERRPERIPDLLTYITAGLETEDRDIAAAAAQALDYLCQDCREHLVPFLPQLQSFFRSVREKLGVDDLMAVAEAIAHVIAAVRPTHAALAALAEFTKPLLENVQEVSLLPDAGKPDLMRAADRMEQLAKVLQVVTAELRAELPPECGATAQEAYAVLDALLARHAQVYFLSERTSALVRRALLFFRERAAPALPALLDRFASCFEVTGYSGYVWIVGKCIDQCAERAEPPLRAALASAFERVCTKVFAMLTASPPDELNDVLDDYLHTCLVTLHAAPGMLLLSPAFPHAFRSALASLQALSPALVGIATDLLRDLLAFHPGPDGSTAPEAPAGTEAVAEVVNEHGFQLCCSTLVGLMTHFPPDTMPVVFAIFRTLAARFPQQLAQWLPPATEQLPPQVISAQERAQFLNAMDSALRTGHIDQVKASLVILYGASRKSRERARMDRELALAER